MANTVISDRKLPERAKLIFYFPNPSQGEDYFRVNLPFFENPTIRESKRARYKKHSLLARSSNLYTYLGADSRKFNLAFKITLPHILFDKNTTEPINIDDYIKPSIIGETESEKKKFSSPSFSESDAGFVPAIKYAQDKYWPQVNKTLFSEDSTTFAEMEDARFKAEERGMVAAPPVVTTTTTDYNLITDAAKQKTDIIDIIMYWVNIIRASVVNHANNPLYGPPIIRLRHGLLYQDVPCICTDYKLEWDEVAGYDINTLLPNRLNIQLSLEEIRTGDFGKFDSMDIVKRDNLAGWEAVIDEGGSHNMDPGYGLFMEDFQSKESTSSQSYGTSYPDFGGWDYGSEPPQDPFSTF